MKKSIIHKGYEDSNSIHWILDLCSKTISNSKYSTDWKQVTCKKCLKMKQVEKDGKK